ncbi:MAG: short-chain fatty acid transporter, partial [Myxococcales bacterium]|nr:short-chain fatty acid transporter [Myxococcales bacterium]
VRAMLARLGEVFSRWAERWVPEPFVLALVLTLITLLGGFAMSGSVGAVLLGWYGGFSSTPLLAFALQMCLILVTGQALASSPPVQRLVRAIARWPKRTPAAAGLVAFIACVTGLVQWGLGAVVAAFVVREIAHSAAEDGRPMDIAVLGAAAYTGLAVWHGGLSGSAPLKAAESVQFTQGASQAIAVSETLFSPLNLLVSGGLLILLPLMCVALAPKDATVPEMPPRESTTRHDAKRSVLGLLVGGVTTLLVLFSWIEGDVAFNLNSVNLFFLALALAAHGSIRSFLDSVSEGARGAGAIIVQFPLYFGILGVMQTSGMIERLSSAMASVASTATFPLLTFLSAGIVNFFVPSGGGQWALQSDVLLTTAAAFDLDSGRTIMAFAYGDEWTNLLQPFWALPLLAITGLKARQIAGYTAVLAIGMGLYVGAVLLFFG